MAGLRHALTLGILLQFADGEILMHVFDVSFNQLTGPLPSFLDFTNVPEYTQRGIFISVSPLPGRSPHADGWQACLMLSS